MFNNIREKITDLIWYYRSRFITEALDKLLTLQYNDYLRYNFTPHDAYGIISESCTEHLYELYKPEEN